jgi:hypothetical protein
VEYIDLIGQEVNGVLVTEKHLEAAENRACTNKRKVWEKQKDLRRKKSNAELLKEVITKEDVVRLIRTVDGLVKKNEAKAKGEEDPYKEVKFDDVRKMDLDLDNPSGYEASEKKFIQSRLQVYKSFYFGDGVVAPNDEFDLLDIIDLEREIEQLKTLIRLNPKKCDEERKLLPVLRKQRSDALQGLNAKKLQRDNSKKIKDDKGAIADQLNELDKDKPIEDLQREVDLEEQEEQKMLKKRKK